MSLRGKYQLAAALVEILEKAVVHRDWSSDDSERWAAIADIAAEALNHPSIGDCERIKNRARDGAKPR